MFLIALLGCLLALAFVGLMLFSCLITASFADRQMHRHWPEWQRHEI
jgi:hypothetical protein